MGPGFCVIGLERQGQSFCSVRPLPPWGNAWLVFPYQRGDILQFLFSSIPTVSPHVEDHPSSGVLGKAGQVSEADLVGYLHKAETSENLRGLFKCVINENTKGSGVYVEPDTALRSICGCKVLNVRFQLFPEAVRVTLLLPSGEILRDLSVVDRDWNEYIARVLQKITGANRLDRANRFLNLVMAEYLLNDANPFARIGLTRLHNEKHWLMLDSLFPLPRIAWFDQLS